MNYRYNEKTDYIFAIIKVPVMKTKAMKLT